MASARAAPGGYWTAPTRLNWKATELLSPSVPPFLLNAVRRSEAVRLRLSVSASTITATPAGP